MGLLDKAKALADKAEQAVSDELKKVRGIASGDIDELIRRICRLLDMETTA